MGKRIKTAHWCLGGFFALVISLAGGGLWYLYKEENLPEPVSLGDLAWGQSSPVDLWDDADLELVEFGPLEEADLDAEISWPEGAVRGEMIFQFGSRSEMEAFLREARRAGLEVEAIAALNMVRVRAGADAELRRAMRMAGNATANFNPVVAAPGVPPLDGMPDAFMPFGDTALSWLGVADNADWGRGVRIAVLDTGVGDHPSLANASITHLSMLDGNPERGGHGTAVTSLLVGQGEVQGIVPGADVLSIQVLDVNGVGDGFNLARGIIEAVDRNAGFIQLSLGTETHSNALWEAVKYAQERGVVLVASGGNDGGGALMYPAAYPGVVAVGSVDAHGQQMPFSNRGDNLSVTAPGFGLVTAGPDGGLMFSTGTSFSSPLVTGAMASLVPELTPAEAARVVTSYTTDAGPPGTDPYYGKGILDLERVEWRSTPGIHDLTVTGHVLNSASAVPAMTITVQNRGTESVGGIALNVKVGGELRTIPIGALGAGESAAGTVSLAEHLAAGEPVEIISWVAAPGITDVRPENDLRASTLVLQPEE